MTRRFQGTNKSKANKDFDNSGKKSPIHPPLFVEKKRPPCSSCSRDIWGRFVEDHIFSLVGLEILPDKMRKNIYLETKNELQKHNLSEQDLISGGFKVYSNIIKPFRRLSVYLLGSHNKPKLIAILNLMCEPFSVRLILDGLEPDIRGKEEHAMRKYIDRLALNLTKFKVLTQDLIGPELWGVPYSRRLNNTRFWVLLHVHDVDEINRVVVSYYYAAAMGGKPADRIKPKDPKEKMEDKIKERVVKLDFDQSPQGQALQQVEAVNKAQKGFLKKSAKAKVNLSYGKDKGQSVMNKELDNVKQLIEESKGKKLLKQANKTEQGDKDE